MSSASLHLKNAVFCTFLPGEASFVSAVITRWLPAWEFKVAVRIFWERSEPIWLRWEFKLAESILKDTLQKYITDIASPKWATWGTSGGVCFERKKLICIYSVPRRIKNDPLDHSLYSSVKPSTSVNSFPMIFFLVTYQEKTLALVS